MRKVVILSLIGLVLAIGITLLIADGGIKRIDPVEPPLLPVKWYPVSGSFTPEVCLPEFDIEEFDLDWLN